MAEINARLSRTTTSQDEPVTLRLEIRGENDAFPDLSGLEQDFEILGRSQQQSVTVINGQRSKTRGLTLTLLPKSLGTLTVPPIPVGTEQSAPLSLEVVVTQTEADSANELGAFIQLEVSKAEAYLQEEVVLTVRLYLAEGVWGESISEPQPSLQHTQVRFLNEEQYQTQQDSRNYLVVERRYAIYAYQAGQLELGGISFRGRSGGPPGGSFFNPMTGPFGTQGPEQRIVRATSDQAKLKILPPPETFTGQHWLPARNLQIVESGLNSAGPLTAGKPATRHIMLIGDGLTTAQLPPIELEIPEGIKQYPERPHDRDNVLLEGISGSRQVAITLVASEAGNYALPAIEIPWWNTETDRQEIARLPALALRVAPGRPDFSPALAPQPFTTSSGETDAPFAGLEAIPETSQQNGDSATNGLLWLLTAGWLITLFGWWYSSRRKEPTAPPPPPPQVIDQLPKDNAAQIVDALTIAYHEADQESARKAWLRWGEQLWPENPPSNLSRLAERCPQPVANAVLALDKAIYSPEHLVGWVRFSPGELLEQNKQEGSDEKPATIKP